MNELTDNYIEEFLSHLKFIKRRADSTIKEYKKILNNYNKYMKKYGLNKIAFLKYLEDSSQLSPRTIKLRIVVLRSFLNYLYENNYINGLNYWKDANAKIPEQSPKGINNVQETILFDIIQKENKFDYIFFNLLLKVGLRISEALSLKKENIIFYNDHAELIITGKGAKERILKITLEYAENLIKTSGKDYVFEISDSLPTQRTMQRRFKKYVLMANQKIDILKQSGKNINYINATPHALRHTCAKKLLNSGKNLEEVRYILGHTNISTTGIYIRSENHTSLLDNI
ncbi:tyrosine-type recombinase/integrase [Oceanotoga sp. DSM 15011]|jgi:integrase/recombinase XerD|uniref:tyrosine-type recombinase/integrase n=1 Tax=Oceanotoga sp. DSM 15011 TaxID=2984951 RepID=UPI0021F4B5EA|nr:tyrosine-type recombinase/integrase [Oceanotoga sp. DSM 15011]UYP00533.1 tyrosine-type recombinase/integrase [Oceanotoga sp. DSM 15011]